MVSNDFICLYQLYLVLDMNMYELNYLVERFFIF